jgi:plastocyanin
MLRAGARQLATTSGYAVGARTFFSKPAYRYPDARMTRLAVITTVYAVVASLVLVAPLSASQEAPPPETETAPAPQPETAPAQPVVEEPAGPDQTAPPDPAPAPPPDPAPALPPDPAPAAPATPAPADPAGPASGESAAPERRARDDASGRRPRATAAASQTVTIRDFEFARASVTIDVGDTVTWSNEGPTPHSATADDGSFDTGVFDDGQSRSHTFDQAGTFSYFCTPHPFMKGTVTVQAASSGGDAGEDTTGGGSTSGDSAADSDDGSGPALPATGLDAGGLALLGLATVALGAWLRRRAAAAG